MADLKDFVRMCKSNQNGEYCKSTCPCYHLHNIATANCVYLITHFTEEVEAIIDKWVSEHPVKTYTDDFFERFPKALKNKDGFPIYRTCVNSLYGTEFKCGRVGCNDCWMKEYKEEELLQDYDGI